MRPEKIRIAVVDDHALFRAGLISLLSQMPEIQVVGEGVNGKDAIDIVKKTLLDLLLLDITMPVMNGIATVKQIKKISAVRILMLTISKQQEDLFGAIQAGADGYLLKNAEPEELYKAILHVFEGGSILSPEVTSHVLKVVRQGSNSPYDLYNISTREREVLVLLSQGKTNPQIANDLHISENTVKTHVRNLIEKLNASNRAEAVRNAIQWGIL